MDSFRLVKITMVVALALVALKLLLRRAGEEIPLVVSVPVLGVVVVAGLMASLLMVARQGRHRREGTLGELAEAAEEAWVPVRKGVVLTLGLVIIGASVPIGFLPGPGGIAVAIAGLALLATEFMWARLLLRRTKLLAKRNAKRAARSIERNPRPWRVPVVGAALGAGIWLAARYLEWVPDRTIYVVSVGPVLMWVVWSYLTLSSWVRRRWGRGPVGQSLPPPGKGGEKDW